MKTTICGAARTVADGVVNWFRRFWGAIEPYPQRWGDPRTCGGCRREVPPRTGSSRESPECQFGTDLPATFGIPAGCAGYSLVSVIVQGTGFSANVATVPRGAAKMLPPSEGSLFGRTRDRTSGRRWRLTTDAASTSNSRIDCCGYSSRSMDLTDRISGGSVPKPVALGFGSIPARRRCTWLSWRWALVPATR